MSPLRGGGVRAQEDTRTELSEVRFVTKEGTKSYKDIAKYGEVMTRPKFTAVDGTHADIVETMTRWQKFDGSQWTDVNNETELFEEGKYRVTVQVRCEYVNQTYKLADGFKLYVDDVEWTDHEDPYNSALTYSYCWVNSGEITIVPGPLIFSNKEFDKEYIYKDELLSFSVAGGASGGKKAYTFSKVSGPSWITVSDAGNVSGTPTVTGVNEDLVVKVTDSSTPTAQTKEITIKLGKTILKPSERPDVENASATSTDIESNLGYYKLCTSPTFTMADGSKAYVANSMVHWQKKNGENWETCNSTDRFAEGTYRIEAQVRIDNGIPSGTTYGEEYKFGIGFKLTVNGTEWNTDASTIGNYDTYSTVWVSSPEMTVTKPAELTFVGDGFAVGANYKDRDITAFSVAAGVSGGVPSYTFSKVSGPDWLAVGTDGNVSGKPTAEGTNANLKIQVMDQEGTTKEIEIPVAKTTLHPDDREKVTEASATSDYLTVIGYGKERKMPAFTMADGSMAYVDEGIGVNKWQKKNADESWSDYTAQNFKAGTYRFRANVKIDGENGKTHMLGDAFKLKVGEKEWAMDGTVTKGDNFSNCWVVSEEITLTNTGAELWFTDDSKFDVPNSTEGTAITKIQNVIENVGGGVEPYTFSIVEPTWLAIDPSTGEISGTPQQADVSETEKELTIKVTDSEDPAASATIKIKVGKVYPTFAHRTEVTEVEATSNISSLIGYAVISQKPTFTMAAGQKAFIPETTVEWWKNVGGEWKQMDIGERFNVGEYKVRVKPHVSGETAKFYKLKKEGFTMKVDGVEWTVSDIFSSDGTDYSYAKAESPVMTVTNTGGAPLKFDSKREFEIPVSYVGEPIAELDVTSGVTGGTEPYVFSITSPATTWLTIGSADGKIKGQPSAMGDNEPLVVRVTDAMGDYKEIDIIVGKTTIRPGDRSVISEVTATSDYAGIPGFQKDNKKPAVTVTSAIASIPENLIEWQKFNGSDWWGYGETTFTGGKYRVKVEVYISGDNGTQYMLSDPFTLKVDGVEWTVTDIHIEDTRSYGTAYSPEIDVTDEREEITALDATSDISGIIGFEKACTTPTITLTDGSVARVYRQKWQKKDGSEWHDYLDATFAAGDYRVAASVIIEGAVGLTHKLADTFTLKVDGEAWTTSAISLPDKRSIAEVYSPEIKVVNTGIISIGADGTRTANVYTLTGTLVKARATNEDLRRLPSGVYVVSGKKFVKK